MDMKQRVERLLAERGAGLVAPWRDDSDGYVVQPLRDDAAIVAWHAGHADVTAEVLMRRGMKVCQDVLAEARLDVTVEYTGRRSYRLVVRSAR